MKLVFPPFVVKPSVASWNVRNMVPTVASPRREATVTISQEAKRLSVSDSGSTLPIDKVNDTQALTDYLKGVDFNNISPDEMAKIAGAMYRTGKYDPVDLNPLVGIGSDTEPPMDKYAKIDMQNHFDYMLRSASEAAQTDASFKVSVDVRTKGSQLLNTLVELSGRPTDKR